MECERVRTINIFLNSTLLTPVLFSSPEEDRGSGWRMMDDKKTKTKAVHWWDHRSTWDTGE